MQVKFKDELYSLGKKERKIESEAPAMRVKMLNDETKVIGMMQPKVQLLVSLPNILELDEKLASLLNHKKVQYTLVTKNNTDEISQQLENFDLSLDFISNEFKDFTLKMGVNISDELFAKSAFIIDKEGVIKYKQIPLNLEEQFDLEELEQQLNEVVNFKPKGHVHENWMAV